MRLAAGLRPDPLGELWRTPRPLSRIRGRREGRERKGLGVGRGRKGREGKDGRGREG